MNFNNTSPVNQKKLYGFGNNFTELANLFDSNQLPNKIIFSGSKGIGKSTMAYHLTNYIFSRDEKNSYDINNFSISDQNHSFNLINKNLHPNFYLVDVIDGKDSIEISQIRKMINYSMKSSFGKSEKIILINNIENLNLNSVNALLKVIEEPNEGVFFFLIFDQNKQVLNTLKSRCSNFNLSLTFDESINISNLILNDDVYNLVNKELINYYNSPGDIVNLLNFANSINLDLKEFTLKDFLFFLIDKSYYKNNLFIKRNISNYVEQYLMQLMKISTTKNSVNKIYNETIKNIYNAKKYNLDMESIFIHLKGKLFNG